MAAEPPPGHRRPGPTGLIGRSSVQAALTSALDTALRGHASTYRIEGEAGAGKTMLIEWLLEEAARRSFRPVAVRPVEGEADLPLAAMIDVIRPLAAWLPALPEEHREVLTAAGGGAGSASTDRLLLAAATLALLAAAAEEAPLLLVVDDAHWLDPESGQALSFAARRLWADRVAVVIAQRPTEDDRICGPWTELRLDGLTEAEVAELLEAVAGGRPATAVVSRITEETRGNPLAVSHLAHRLPRESIVGDAPLPLTLPMQEVARRTFSRLVLALPERTRAALAIVAAAGSAAAQLTRAALPELGLSMADLLPAEDAGLLVSATGQLHFAHPLYRATALEVVGPAGVRRAHAALAVAARGHDLQRHAWHRGLSVVGTDEDAAASLQRAADAAEQRVGAAASVGMRRLALSLSPAGLQYDRRELALACALSAAGHHNEARSHLQGLLTRDGVPPDIYADASCYMARLMLWDTPLDRQPVAAHIPDDLPPRHRAAILAVAALRARNMAEFRRWADLSRAAHTQMTALLRECRPGAAVDDDVAETLFLLPTLSLVAEVDLVGGAHHSPAIDELIARVRRLLTASRGTEVEASAVRRGLVDMLDDLVGSPAQTLTWTSALDLADELLTLWLSAARARPSSVAYLMLARTELAGWTAKLLVGLTAADRGIEVSREVGSHALAGWTHAYASRLCAALGDERGCLERVAAATELGAMLNEPGPSAWGTHAHAQLLLGTGRAEDAVRVLAPVAEFASSLSFRGVRSFPWQPDYIEALARSGHTDQADVVLREWLANVPDEPDDWHRAVIARCKVLVHGEDHVDELVSALHGGALRLTPIEEARAQLVAGTALRRRRRPAAARAMTETAATTFSRVGALGWRAMAEDQLTDCRCSGTDPDHDLGLSPQEMRVALEIASGLTTREAATRLFCSSKTVEYHLTRVYAKLGVRSRAALASRLASAVGPPAPVGKRSVQG
ncbi:BREX system ATP-binding domain-containing protein [Geodermatophilus sp. SYSU D00779]